MKFSFLFILLSLAIITVAAQQKKEAVKDPLPPKLIINNTTTAKKVKTIKTPESEITEKLNNLLSTYSNKPNTPATWTQIKAEAQSILFGYYKNGTLLGTKPEEAFFVKMGNETMTATDIANHKMILQVGIAMVKPADFKIITIEKINALL